MNINNVICRHLTSVWTFNWWQVAYGQINFILINVLIFANLFLQFQKQSSTAYTLCQQIFAEFKVIALLSICTFELERRKCTFLSIKYLIIIKTNYPEVSENLNSSKTHQKKYLT